MESRELVFLVSGFEKFPATSNWKRGNAESGETWGSAVIGDAGMSGDDVFEGKICSCDDGSGSNSCSISSLLCTTTAFVVILSSVICIFKVTVCVRRIIVTALQIRYNLNNTKSNLLP